MDTNQNKVSHMIDVVFVLILFLLFATSLLMLVTLGADIYQDTLSNMEKNYHTRTAFSYVSEKIRQKDSSSELSILEVNGTQMLCISQTINDTPYNTYLYHDNDGYLKELLVRVDLDLSTSSLNAGQEILKLEEFSLEQKSDHLLLVSLCAEDDSPISFYVSTQK